MLRCNRRAEVSGAWANQISLSVLLDSVTEPTNGPAQRKDRHSRDRRQVQSSSQHRQSEINVRGKVKSFAHFLHDCMCQRQTKRIGISVGDEAEKPPGTWIAVGIQAMSEAGDSLP